MLQQTRIEAVLPYYRRFISELPTVAELAVVPQEKLLKLWEGLGYYSRARNLQKAAQVIMDRYNGELPADYEALLSLPGIGPYTAGAIASIAYSVSVPAVDGNVMRVLARLTGDSTDVLSTAGKKRFTDLAWQMVPEQDSGRFNQAIMELGERICLPNGTPLCDACPLQSECSAFAQGKATKLPVRIKKVKRRREKRHVVVVRIEGQPPAVLLHKRPDSGLLAGLWELPNTLESDALLALPKSICDDCRKIEDLPECKHVFSHVEWQMTGTVYHLPKVKELPPEYHAVTLDDLRRHYPLPSAFRYFAEQLPRILNEEN